MQWVAVSDQQAEILVKGLDEVLKKLQEHDEVQRKQDPESRTGGVLCGDSSVPGEEKSLEQEVYGSPLHKEDFLDWMNRMDRKESTPHIQSPVGNGRMGNRHQVQERMAYRSIRSRAVFSRKMPTRMQPKEGSVHDDIQDVRQLSEEVKQQLKDGQLQKQTLIALNEKLGQLQINYGNIAAISLTVAGIISGLKDLIDLIQMLD